MSEKTRHGIEAKIIHRAVKDEAFKKQLLSDPKQVIEEELGAKLPPGLKINVLEESADNVYIVLPHVASGEEELTEHELAAADSWTCGLTCTDCGEYTSFEPGSTPDC